MDDSKDVSEMTKRDESDDLNLHISETLKDESIKSNKAPKSVAHLSQSHKNVESKNSPPN